MNSQELWEKLHEQKRYRPKYPSESVVQYVFRNFDRNGKTKILDCGCGTGRHVCFLGEENIIPYGIDFSKEGIEYTKEILKANGMEQFIENMKVAHLTDIPIDDEFVDGIICYGVLYYLKINDIKIAIQEMKRVLKPNGKIFMVIRTTEDYRCKEKACKKTDEKNTFIVNEGDENKCAHSENGMTMHFFEKEEIEHLMEDFIDLKIDKITETHENGKFCDSNWIVSAKKRG